MGLISWCNRFIKSGYYLLFAVVPLLLTPVNYELFEYNKMMAVYVVTSFIVTSWVVKSIAQKEFRLGRTPLDIPIALFVLSQLVSALFSIDPHVSWFGYYSRFNGGMWSVISYILLFYGFVSNSEIFTDSKEKSGVYGESYMGNGKKKNIIASKQLPDIRSTIPNLLIISLVTATLIAVYGVLEHMGIDKSIWVQDVQNRVFSTLGQPNWLAAYLIALIPLTWALALNTQYTISNTQQGKKHFHWILVIGYWILSVLFFLVLLYTRSRSGLLALAVTDVIFLGIVILQRASKRSKENQSLALIILHALFALVIFINGSGVEQIDRYVSLKGLQSGKSATVAPKVAGPALETGGTESGVIRKYVWQAAISAWKSTTKTILIGTGTETFAFAFYQFRPVAHNMTSEWDFLYNKAHNEYLNYLATTGIFGLGSYLLFIGIFIVWFFNTHIFNTQSPILNTQKNKNFFSSLDIGYWRLEIALFSGWLSILVTNFFGFSVVLLQVFFFLFPAIIFALVHHEQSYRFPIKPPPWARWVAILIGLFVIIRICSFWYADKSFAHGYQYDRAGLYDQATPSLLTAMSINPGEPLYHDELAGSYAALSVASFGAKNATQAAQFATLAVSESDKAIHISPKNVNFLKTRTKVYYTLSSLDPSFNTTAIDTLRQTLTLSPNDPKISYNLAILFGRDGQNDQAITYLLQAKKLKADYRDVYIALNIFYTEMGKKAEAKAVLQEYLDKINPNDKDFIERIK